MKRIIEEFIKKLKEMPDFDRVKFVYLFGSQALGKANKMSDYDFAVYYEGNKRERFKFGLKANYNEKIDVKVFQDLPLFIQKEVLKGKILYVKDRKFLYEMAYLTIKRFSEFKKYYYDYIRMEKIK